MPIRFSRQRAMRVQALISMKAQIQPLPTPTHVAAVDVAYSRKKNTSYAAAAVLETKTMKIIETTTAQAPTTLPYMPGFLAFRELTPMLRALYKLKTPYQVILVDGHGISHPRRAGIATHLGVILDKPTIGIAKKILVGKIVEKHGIKLLVDKGEPIAAIHDGGGKWRPLYVSPGHKSDIETSYKLVNKLRKNSGLPMPLNIADRLSKEIKNCGSFSD